MINDRLTRSGARKATRYLVVSFGDKYIWPKFNTVNRGMQIQAVVFPHTSNYASPRFEKQSAYKT